MPIIIVFTDNPAADPDLRGAHMPNHLAFLQDHAGRISAAGPLSTEAGAADGGLWVVETEDIAEAEALVRADPFWSTGLRHSHRALRWRRVFESGTASA